jgi:hypothetical protein
MCPLDIILMIVIEERPFADNANLVAPSDVADQFIVDPSAFFARLIPASLDSFGDAVPTSVISRLITHVPAHLDNRGVVTRFEVVVLRLDVSRDQLTQVERELSAEMLFADHPSQFIVRRVRVTRSQLGDEIVLRFELAQLRGDDHRAPKITGLLAFDNLLDDVMHGG